MFGIVKQDYTLPVIVLREMGISISEIDRIAIDRSVQQDRLRRTGSHAPLSSIISSSSGILADILKVNPPIHRIKRGI